MRKIILGLFFIFALTTSFLVKAEPAKACVTWCDPVCTDPNLDGSCNTWATECGDDRPCGGIIVIGQNCPGGTYACNRASDNYCCPLGSGGGGGGGYVCDNPGYYHNCPANTVKTAVVGSSACLRYEAGCGLGNAQATAGCCEETTIRGTCSDFYCCRWNQFNQCSKMCRDCTPDETYCIADTVIDYVCAPTCSLVIPTAPTLSSPENGASVASTTVNLVWRWDAGSSWGTACPGPNVNEYKVYVGTTNPPTTLYTTESSTTLQKTYTGTNGTTYYWYVAAANGSAIVASSVRSFTIQNTIGGRVFNVEDNVCPGGVGSNFGGLNVAIGGINAPVAADGTYSEVVADGSYSVSVGIPTGYSCANGAGCGAYPCTKNGVAPGTLGLNFYLSSNKVMWWQAEGAGIYAGSNAGPTTIRSTIPASILTNRYLVLANTGGTAAAVLRASGTAPTATSGTLGVGTVNADGWSAKTTYKGKRADYSYFKNQMGLLSTTTSETNLNSKPAAGSAFNYMADTATITDPWNVLGTEKYVIFVNGDLNINANVTVAPGGFLAFVVKGSINVGSSVTEIHGLFVADSDFNTLSAGTDTQLTVEGSVVAWGDVRLNRDLVANNSNSPAELFVYRTDLLAAMPDEMKSFVMQWSEVVPGTYEEQ